MNEKNCLICNKVFVKGRRNTKWWLAAKYCSWQCSGKSKVGKPGGMRGKTHTKDALLKIRAYRHTPEQREKMFGHTAWNKGKTYLLPWNEKRHKAFKEKFSGENNPRWVKDRSKLVTGEKKHLNSNYKIWMKTVKDRDGWKCKMSSTDCSGRLEAHHILRWSDFPELRYEVNNGIALCAFHHPRKRSEEQRLSPYFTELIVNET